MVEADIEETIAVEAEEAGWFVRKLTWIGVTGAPDRLFAFGGRTVFVEFKAPHGRVSVRQMREHDRMRRAGMEVHVIDSVEMGRRVLGLA